MIDIKFIRENPSLVQKASEDKNIAVNIDHLLEIDNKYREVSSEVQSLREERNKYAREQNIEKGRELKDRLDKLESALAALKGELDTEVLKIPNPARPDVKVGKDESENEIVRTVGEPTKFDFKPKDHLDLGESLDIIDVQTASKISGTRFYYLKNEGALLEMALRQLAFDTLVAEGFSPILPPLLIKTEIMRGLGYMENGGDEDMYIFEKDDLALVGTSEQSVVPIFADKVLRSDELPKRFVAFSTCFRREAGSYGKDTKGILRAHQFDKVEMVSFTKEGEDDKEHDYLLSIEEKLLQSIGIPYQVIKMCTGDLGFPAARKYDLEGWIPSENKYRELTSTSTTTDFQSRSLNMKYREGDQNKFLQVLNGTAFSTRPIIAILENFQESDGSVVIPEVLRKYMGNISKISPKK